MKNNLKLALKYFCLAMVLLSATITHSQDLQMVRSKIVDGFYFAITSSQCTTNNTPMTDLLNFGIWRTDTNNKAIVYVPTATGFIYQVALFDTNGIEQPKTHLGQTIGTRFLDLQPTFSNDKNYKLTIEHAMDWPDIGLQHLFFPFKPGYGDGHFYTPSDLFETTNSASYTLKVSFQIIVRTGHGFDKTSHLVRFPPVAFPLVKP